MSSSAPLQLLSVSLRPLNLPREFPQLFVTVVYRHPRANVDRAAQYICDVTQKLVALSTDAPKFVLGDFNNTIQMVHICKCVLKRAKCVERHVKVWNEDSVARLQGCFDCTNWDVFRDSCDSLDELTDVVTS